jgi:hypothetical protein
MSVKGEFGCFAQLHLVCCKLPFNVSGKKLKKPVILVNNPDLSNLTETLCKMDMKFSACGLLQETSQPWDCFSLLCEFAFDTILSQLTYPPEFCIM